MAADARTRAHASDTPSDNSPGVARRQFLKHRHRTGPGPGREVASSWLVSYQGTNTPVMPAAAINNRGGSFGIVSSSRHTAIIAAPFQTPGA